MDLAEVCRKSQRVRAIRRWTSKAERPFPLAADDQRSGDGDASWNQGRNYRMDGKQTTFMLCALWQSETYVLLATKYLQKKPKK